jgi:hypothetical protein
LGALIVGLLLPHLAQAAGGVRAALPGRVMAAPDGVSQTELLAFDPGFAPALLAAPESSVRIATTGRGSRPRRTLTVARHVYAPDATPSTMGARLRFRDPTGLRGAIETSPAAR